MHVGVRGARAIVCKVCVHCFYDNQNVFTPAIECGVSCAILEGSVWPDFYQFNLC
jgi:hypothetical protein